MKMFLPIKNLFLQSKEVFLELRGSNTLLAEGYCKIDTFSARLIVLESPIDKIAVRGENLNLTHLSFGRIAVKGDISAVEFL